MRTRLNTFGTLAFTAALLGITLPVACGGDDTDTSVVTGSTGTGTSNATGQSADSAGTMAGTGGSTLQFIDGPMTGAGTGGDMSSSSTGMGEGGTGVVTYAKDFVVTGTTMTDSVQVYDVAVDGLGNIVVVGSFRGTIDFDGAGATPAVSSANNTDFNAFVAKFDQDGVLTWVKAAGTNDPQTANAVAIDKDNRVGVCGTFRGSMNWGGNALTVQDSQYTDAYAVVFDQAGTHIASQRYGANSLGKSDLCSGAAFDPVGNLVITGQFQGSMNFGATTVGDNNGDFKIFLAKITPNAVTKAFTEVFAKAYASPGVAALGETVTVDATGDIALGGFSEGPISFGGPSLTPKYPGIQQSVVARFDSKGMTKFQLMLHSEADSRVTSVAFHTNGDLIVGGVFKKSIEFGGGPLAAVGANNDAFVARFDKTNKLLHAVRIGDGKSDELNDLAVDPAGFPVFGGSFQGSPVINSKTTLMAQGLRDGLVVKLANDDAHGYWGFGFGDTDFQEVNGIAVDKLGNVVFAGSFKGAIDLGVGTRVAPNGSQGLFVGKFLP
jgi:hypothetical protein